MIDSWGYHLLCDCKSGDIAAITSVSTVQAFVDELVDAIDMVAYGNTLIEHFATHDPDKAGISFCQLIETSNITGHFVDKNGNFYIDVFSCKPYDIEVAQNIIKKYFKPIQINTKFIQRDADIALESQKENL